MPIDELFIAEVAAHIIVLEKAQPDESWSRHDRRWAAQDYIEQQMKNGSDVARAHWYLDGNEYDQMLEEIAVRSYRARLTQLRAELDERKGQEGHTVGISRWVDSGTIPPQVYDAYHLAYNNFTYRAVRLALEETADISNRGDRRITSDFIGDTMNCLIDASFERLGAVLYQGSETKLHEMLRPLDSRLTGLALRHLANFGVSPVPSNPTPMYLLTKDLNIMRAELASSEQDARRQDGYKAKLSAEWLKAAVLLIGAAADLLTDTYSPGTVWRRGAQDKLTAAFFALKGGIGVALDEDYTLPPKLSDALMQMIDLLSRPDDPQPKP